MKAYFSGNKRYEIQIVFDGGDSSVFIPLATARNLRGSLNESIEMAERQIKIDSTPKSFCRVCGQTLKFKENGQ